MKNQRLKAIAIIGLILVVLPLGFYFFFCYKIPPLPSPLKEYWKAPGFVLTNQDSAKISSDDNLKGFIYVADFFFTHCNSICPMLSDSMKTLQKEYSDKPQLKLVSFSIDPDRDNVSALRAYGKKYGAYSEKWSFLTGDAKFIRDSIGMKGFKVPVVPDNPDDGQFTHTDRFILVDGEGVIRGFYHIPSDFELLHNDIERLLVEKKKN